MDIDQLKKNFEQMQERGKKQRQQVDELLKKMNIKSVNENENENSNENLNQKNNIFGSKENDDANSTINKATKNHTPLSVQLEVEALEKHKDRLSFRPYLEKGYKKYLNWLSMTLGSPYSQHLNFCVARSINKHENNKHNERNEHNGHNYMGLDLEAKYLLKRLENIFSPSEMKYYEHMIEKTLKENIPELSDAHIRDIIQTYLRNPQSFNTVLSDRDFAERLRRVPSEVLDQHSFLCWRNENHQKLNQKPYPVTRDDILNGESIVPPSAKHLGIQMLQMYGYLPMLTDVRKPNKYGVTFV